MLRVIKGDLDEINSDLQAYLEDSEAYLKLKVFKISMKLVTQSV